MQACWLRGIAALIDAWLDLQNLERQLDGRAGRELLFDLIRGTNNSDVTKRLSTAGIHGNEFLP